MPKIVNLVFEGGGVKVIAESASLACLYEAKQLNDVKRVCGTSAGALLAILYSIGFNPVEAHQICMKKNFNDFKDGNIVTDGIRFIKEHGIYEGTHLLEFVEQKIVEKLGCSPKITFADLKAMQEQEILETGKSDIKDPYIVITNLSQRKAIVASFEDPIYKDMPIALAVRMSMSYPGAFAAVEYQPTPEQPKQVYVDGGVRKNFYLNLFDDPKYIEDTDRKESEDVFNSSTLGFRLDDQKEFDEYEKREPVYYSCSGIDFWESLLEASISSQEGLYRDQSNASRTICANTYDISTMDLGISHEDKIKLSRSGTQAGLNYLQSHGIHFSPLTAMITTVELDNEREVMAPDIQEAPALKDKYCCVS